MQKSLQTRLTELERRTRAPQRAPIAVEIRASEEAAWDAAHPPTPHGPRYVVIVVPDDE